MSDNKHKADSVDMLSRLTEAQLKEILSLELMSDNTDVDLIKRVNSAIKAKSSKEIIYDVDEKWKEFVDDYVVSEPLYDVNEDHVFNQTSKPTIIRKFLASANVAVAAIVFIVLLSGMLTAYALGYDVFEAIATWTKETFSFTQQTEIAPRSPAHSPNTSNFTELQYALDEYGITEELVPTYIPEGYEQTEFYVEDMQNSTIFAAVFENENNTIIIQIFQYSEGSNRAEYEKDDGVPEIYVINDISHYIMTNMGKYHTVWTNGLYEVSISGLKTKDELIKMIDSIHER